MAGFLFLLVVAGVIAVVIWDYRRKAARREAASQERFERMFNAKAAAAPAPEPLPATAPDGGAKSVSKSPASTSAFSPKERFLGRPETLIYLLLKAGVPDHAVFANVSLASVVGTPDSEAERDPQARRLSQYRLDFVICDRNMRIVAVIELDTPGGADAAGIRRFKADCLRAAGMRLVRLNPASLPRREEIGPLVRGKPDQASRAD